MDIYDKIEHLIKYNGISRKEMCKGSNTSYSTYTSMINRRSEKISMRAIVKIANFFNVTVDYLMRDDLPIEPILYKDNSIITLSKDKENLLKLYDNLNQFGQEKVIERVEELTQIPKYSLNNPQEPNN